MKIYVEDSKLTIRIIDKNNDVYYFANIDRYIVKHSRFLYYISEHCTSNETFVFIGLSIFGENVRK